MRTRGRKEKGREQKRKRDASDAGSSPWRSGHDDEPGLAGPSRPDGWRDLVNSDYDYPPEMDDLSRRDRRYAKKEWRKDDHAQRMAWLREQRQAEPVSPISILVVVILLGIIVLGIGGGLPKLLGNDNAKQPVGLLTPGDPLPRPTDPGASASQPVTSQASEGLTTPPPQTGTPPSTAIATSAEIVTAWARRFYTRDPMSESYEQLVSSASQYMTADLASSFIAQGDSTYDALKTDGGRSRVVSAAVATPKEGDAPADTPTRISRIVSVVIDITGKDPQKITVPLLVTLVQQDAKWVISDVDGGTGP